MIRYCNPGCEEVDRLTAYHAMDLYYRRMRSVTHTNSHDKWSLIDLNTACHVEVGHRPLCFNPETLPSRAHTRVATYQEYERLPSPGRVTTVLQAVWLPERIATRSHRSTPQIFCSTREQECKFDNDGDGRYE